MNPLINAIGFFILLFTLIVFLIFMLKLVIYFYKRKGFPRKTLASTIIGFIMFLSIFIYIQYFFSFNDINRNDKQEGLEISSPSGKYTANAYYELYGGAAGGVNVWIEITNNIENTTKIIYYADAKNNFHMYWVDEESLSITNAGGGANSNRNVLLKVANEIYHENGLACQSLLMKSEFEKCYQYENK
jgi:amino acid transporter